MKRDISLQSVKTLFRLDLRSRFGTTHKQSLKSRIAQYSNYLFSAVVYAVLVMGIYYLTNMFVVRSGLRMEFLVIVTTATMALATVICTGNVIKNLYMNGDNEMLLRFPVNGTEILLSKTIYCFLHNAVVCLLTMLPFYVVFGVVTKAGAGFYFASLGVIVLAMFFPYFIANILAVPVMRLMNIIKNQFLIVLILTIAIVCGLFVFYMVALGNVLNYLSRENQTLFSADMIERYRIFAENAYPFKWYAYLVNGKAYSGITSLDMGLSFLYIFLMTAVLGVIAYFITSKAYYKTILYGIENNKASFVKKTKNVQRSVFGTLLRREFLLIFRSFNYSFQYLAMACAAPLMVFYCGKLAATMGTRSVGGQIVPGLELMVTIIFITIIVSFASTTVSREGDAFYHTKIIPVSYTQQILVKFFLYAIVATVSVGLCVLISGIYFTTDTGGHLLHALDNAAIFGISEMTVISLTSLSIWADIKSPTFNVSGDGELVKANKNVALSMFVGIAVAVAYGLFCMVFSFLPLEIGGVVLVNGADDAYLVLAIVTAVLMCASLAALFVNLNKRYQKIMP
jgi:ABC-2 type transport system permease protein